MAPRVSIVLDCRDPVGLSGFWAGALGYRAVEWPGANYEVLADPERTGPVLILQRVGEPKDGKNRMHIDLHAPDLDAEVARLAGLGASRSGAPVEEHGVRWVVMADPEGNEFCVVTP